MIPPITIVSGLPRSGTSMMMKMLESGGMEVLVDNARKADGDNPRGYYEFERTKKMKQDTSWLSSAHGKVVKVVSMLLYDLPLDRKYKIIFMRRKMKEILVSQKSMLRRKGAKESDISDGEMAKIFSRHLKAIEGWVENRENIEVLYINYNDVVDNPYEISQIVNRFLDNGLDVKKVAKVVDQSLYRNRVDFG